MSGIRNQAKIPKDSESRRTKSIVLDPLTSTDFFPEIGQFKIPPIALFEQITKYLTYQ